MLVIQIGITFACTFQKNIEVDLGQGERIVDLQLATTFDVTGLSIPSLN